VSSIIEYHGSEGERPVLGKSLRHISTETIEGGMVWLQYEVEAAA
jgi:hypothetical protein